MVTNFTAGICGRPTVYGCFYGTGDTPIIILRIFMPYHIMSVRFMLHPTLKTETCINWFLVRYLYAFEHEWCLLKFNPIRLSSSHHRHFDCHHDLQRSTDQSGFTFDCHEEYIRSYQKNKLFETRHLNFLLTVLSEFGIKNLHLPAIRSEEFSDSCWL